MLIHKTKPDFQLCNKEDQGWFASSSEMIQRYTHLSSDPYLSFVLEDIKIFTYPLPCYIQIYIR